MTSAPVGPSRTMRTFPETMAYMPSPGSPRWNSVVPASQERGRPARASACRSSPAMVASSGEDASASAGASWEGLEGCGRGITRVRPLDSGGG